MTSGIDGESPDGPARHSTLSCGVAADECRSPGSPHGVARRVHAARDLDARILALSGTSAATTLFLLAAAPVFAAIALTQDALIISLRDASLAFVSGAIALGIGLLMLVSKQDPATAPSSRVAAIPLD